MNSGCTIVKVQVMVSPGSRTSSAGSLPSSHVVGVTSQPAGAAAVPGLAEHVWFNYERDRARYEMTLGRREKPEVMGEFDVKVLGVRHPHDPWAREPGQRKKRSDAGVQKGPRHLQRAARDNGEEG